MFLLTFSNFPT